MRFFRVAFCGLCVAALARATLVTPPTIDSVSIPATATLGQTVTVSVTAHANTSDNTDGHNWNGSMEVIDAINISVQGPGQSTWTSIYGSLSTPQTPATVSPTFNITLSGTYQVQIQVMDGRPWFSNTLTYQITVPTVTPSITSSLTTAVNQRQTVSYNITANNSPASYNATGLPPGLSVNTTTGLISGAPTGSGTYSTTLSATNSAGTGTATLTWTVVAATISGSANVSPSSIKINNGPVSLISTGTTNFTLGWVEHSILLPSGSWATLSNTSTPGTQSYTPTGGLGTYYYRVRIVDVYQNYYDTPLKAFYVDNYTLTPPSSVTTSSVKSTSLTLSWSGASSTYPISFYDIYRNNVFLARVYSGTTYTDTTATGSTTYVYQVFSIDNQGNESTDGGAVTVTTATALDVFTPAP